MFERFIRLSEAKAALRKGRFEQALQLAGDPLIAPDRRAEEVVERALQGLLDRARVRRGEGALSGALADLGRILAIQPEYEGAQQLRDEVERELADDKRGADAARVMLADARRMVDAGDLEAAERLCQAARKVHRSPVDERAVEQLIAGRRELAEGLLGRAVEASERGEWPASRDLLVKARAHARGLAGASDLARDVASGLAEELVSRLRTLREDGDAAAAYALLSRERGLLPELDEVQAVRQFSRDTASIQTEQLRELLGRGDVEAAVEIYRDLDPRLQADPALASLTETMVDVARGLDSRDRGDFTGAAECLGRANSELGSAGVAGCIEELEREREQVDDALREARELAGGGRLVEARQRLAPYLTRWPLHEVLRREMEILDQGARGKEEQLVRARELAREGKLAEASSIAVALAIPGPQGEEARLLLVDVQARMDLVQRGLDQVRRAVHGRHSGTSEGLRHCVKRLEQLGNVQVDSADLVELARALTAEISGVEALERAVAAFEQDRPKEVAEHMAVLGEVGGKLLRPDRLDARVLELADRMLLRAEKVAAAGRLTAARSWQAAAAGVPQRFSDVLGRCAALSVDVEARERRAVLATEEGRVALEQRDLARAEECLDRARSTWVDGAPVLGLERSLREVRGQEAALEQVERLASKEDFAEAHRQLDQMPPTPGVLRTRIFDIKQGIAKAQGLDGGFLLRVDEGGEFVVLRGDRISIGNVREAKADLVVLANIAGRHASIHRSMSFHGGMQDRVRADDGEVAVSGRQTKDHVLAGGDRVRLGPTLEFTYQVPSKRSVSASLTLSSGFQVAGTDKVLLMRDRGRDGRLLIGPGDDVHVRVPDGCPEVELFALKDGQVRIRCSEKATMDGRPISGEHPVTAGSVVSCGRLSFVLQPLSLPT